MSEIRCYAHTLRSDRCCESNSLYELRQVVSHANDMLERPCIPQNGGSQTRHSLDAVRGPLELEDLVR